MRCLTLFFLTFPLSLYAGISYQTDSLVYRNVDEVEVVAVREREVVAPQRLSGERLQQLSALSVADAVRYFSGIQLKDYGGVGGMKTVDMRSMGSNHLGVFYDGLQIGNAQNGIVDLGRFSLDNMEEVAVYNGQKADVFQPAKDFGTSGSIYLKTHRSQFTKNRYNIRTSFRTGSFGLVNPSIVYEQKIGNNISLSTNAEYTHADGRYSFRYHKTLVTADGKLATAWDTTGTRQNGDVSALRLEGTLFGDMAGLSWQAKVYFYDSERGIPRAIVRNVWTSSQRQWDRDFFVQGNLQRVSDGIYATKVSAKFSRNFLRYLNPDTTLMYVDNSFTQHALYLSSANVWHVLPWIDADFSVDYEHNWMWSDMAYFPRPVRNVFLGAMALSLHSHNLKAQGSLLANMIEDKSNASQSKTDKWVTKFTPALFLNYDVSSHLSLRAFAKRMFRMPTFNDLYYTDIGNVSLKPEFATQFNVGTSFSHGFPNALFQLSLDAYHNRITDKILAVPKGNSQYRWMMMNIGRVDVDGLDAKLSFDGDWTEDVKTRLSVNYTYQCAQDLSDPSDDGPRGTYHGQISYIPRHSGSAIANVSLGRWTACYSFIYVGERYHVSANIPENYEPSWYTHDLSVSGRWRLGGVDMNLSAEMNNLLDQQYDVVLNYPMPGRNGKLILRVQW